MSNTPGPSTDNFFVNLVDFKWLMAGVGWWVDLSRLQSDTAYIDECLHLALRSDSELLRKRSVELLGLRPGAEPFAMQPRRARSLAWQGDGR